MRRPDWQLSRNGLFWVLLAFGGVVVLHADHLPAWVIGLSALASLWRILEYRGTVPFPSWPLKGALVIGCMAGLVLQYRTMLALEPMVSMLIAGFALKLLEMHHKRDAVVLVYLAFFTAAVDSVFTQEVFQFAGVLITFIIAVTALVSINQARNRGFSAGTSIIALRMLATALPLMLVLFLVVPRLGALWSIPGPKSQAPTGISDVMAPGDFSQLSRSDELAFRARFEGPIPPRSSLYWRGLVFSEFDGREWSQADLYGPDTAFSRRGSDIEGIERHGQAVRYTITLEPTYSHWLFALSTPATAEPGVRLLRDSRLVSIDEVTLKRGYDIRSWLDYRLDPEGLHPNREALERAIPRDSNPETVRIARQWAAEAGSPEDLIERVLRLYNESFVYTLEPPQLGEHTIDEFLWRTRRGFCEHFAGSFAFFMRAAGHPARVVGGYLGGEIHPTENFVTVRQYDAHAWAEVWIEGRGWVRVDPTAAVAPERVEMSVADLFADDDWFLADSPLSLARFRHFGLVNWLVLQMDYVDYVWGTWVLGYDKRQFDFLQDLLGRITFARVGLLFLLAVALSALPYLLVRWVQARREKPDPRDVLIRKFCDKLARAGSPRRKGEGILDFAHRIAAQRPELAPAALAIAEAYVANRYDPKGPTGFADLQQAVRRFRIHGR